MMRSSKKYPMMLLELFGGHFEIMELKTTPMTLKIVPMISSVSKTYIRTQKSISYLNYFWS
jgi:hypothetical protein